MSSWPFLLVKTGRRTYLFSRGGDSLSLGGVAKNLWLYLICHKTKYRQSPRSPVLCIPSRLNERFKELWEYENPNCSCISIVYKCSPLSQALTLGISPPPTLNRHYFCLELVCLATEVAPQIPDSPSSWTALCPGALGVPGLTSVLAGLLRSVCDFGAFSLCPSNVGPCIPCPAELSC